MCLPACIRILGEDCISLLRKLLELFLQGKSTSQLVSAAAGQNASSPDSLQLAGQIHATNAGPWFLKHLRCYEGKAGLLPVGIVQKRDRTQAHLEPLQLVLHAAPALYGRSLQTCEEIQKGCVCSCLMSCSCCISQPCALAQQGLEVAGYTYHQGGPAPRPSRIAILWGCFPLPSGCMFSSWST